MKTRFATYWDDLRSSLWLVPSVMAMAAVLLSFVTVSIDHHIEASWANTVGWVWAGSPEGARAVLSTIASSVISIAGVTFSITITALVLASSQFGSRLLRNFKRDRGNQIVLGTFIATFVYCLLVLRTVRSVEETRFVPYISVSIGMLLALFSLGVLIYFIHHMADSIQADNLAASVAQELHESIERLFPARLGKPSSSSGIRQQLAQLEADAVPLFATQSGYLQSIDEANLIRLAEGCQGVVILRHNPGSFITSGSILAHVSPAKGCTSELLTELQKTFIMGRHPSATQDARFSIHQLVEIAVRALSPGINDPHTAITCIDWIGETLGRLAQRDMPSPYRRSTKGELRVVVAEPVNYSDFCHTALDPIREYGASSVGVTIHTLQTIGKIARQIRREEDRDILRLHSDLLSSEALTQIESPYDRARIEKQYQATLHALARQEN